MTIIGLGLGVWFGILFIGLGPFRAMLPYMAIAPGLPPALQVRLAVRTVLVGAVLSALILLLGGGTARSYSLRPEVLLIAAGLALGRQSLLSLVAEPSDLPDPPKITDPLRLAISPLAVPAMISPVGVVALFLVAMEARDWTELVAFEGLVLVVLALNLGAMLLSRRLARYLTRAISELIQQVFAVLVLALSVRLVLEGLAGLGLLTIAGI
jgi:small neutral amino acid transporter SnatA (MarC family)